MKHLKFIFMVIFAAVAFAACEDGPSSEVKAPILKFVTTDVGLKANGEAVTLAYEVENVAKGETLELSVVNNADWLAVDAATANIITFSATLNETEENRMTEVVFGYKGAESVTVTVVQAGGYKPSLQLEVTSVGATTITFNITASHDDLTWIPMVTYAEYWQEPVNDEEIYIYDLEYFKYLAESYGVSLEMFLEEMLGRGSQEGITIERLDPETEFVVYAYGLSLEGERLTDVVWVTATTDKAWEGDITFEFDIKEEDYIMEFTVTPSHLGVDYYYGVASEKEIDLWKSQAGSDDLAAAIQLGDIESTMQLLMDYQFIDERIDYYEMFNNYNVMDDGWAEVKAGTKYYVYAAKWNKNCEITGSVSTAEYTTPKANLSDNVITLEVTELTQSSVTIAMKTTNYDPYVVLPVKSSVIEGMTDEEIYAFVTDEYSVLVNEYTFIGNRTKMFTHMRPGNNYTILAFGNLAGVQTTDMIKLEITTLESGDPMECTFEFLCIPSSDNVWLEITPSDKGHHYFYEVYPADYTAEDAKSFINYVIREDYEGSVAAFSSWRLWQGDLTTTEYDLAPLTDYKLGVVIMDYDTGEFLSDVLFSDVFTTTEVTYADVSITVNWDQYFDADELCEAGYTQYNGCKGKCIVPVDVVIEGDYSEYYFAFYGNDLTDEATYPDKIFYQDLQNNGLMQKSVIIDLPYDKLMTATAVVYDLSYNPGKIFRKAVTFTKDGASPVSDYAAARQSLPYSKSLVVAPDVEAETVVASVAQPMYDEVELKSKAQAFVEEYRLANLKRDIERRGVGAAHSKHRIAR